ASLPGELEIGEDLRRRGFPGGQGPVLRTVALGLERIAVLDEETAGDGCDLGRGEVELAEFEQAQVLLRRQELESLGGERRCGQALGEDRLDRGGQFSVDFTVGGDDPAVWRERIAFVGGSVRGGCGA